MYNNTFYKKQRSTTPKEKDLQLPGSGQSARQQSYKQTPAGYGGATNTSTYKSPSTSGYTGSTTGYKNNANSGYNSYNTGSTGSYKSPSTSSYTNSNTGYKNSASTGYKSVNTGYTSPAAGYKSSTSSGYNSYNAGSTGGYTNSVDYGNAVAPVKPVGTVNPSMSAYKQPTAYPSANLPSAYSANTRYNTPANAAGNTALRSPSAAYKSAAQSPVSATNRLSGYSAPGKIPSPSLQSAYQSTNFPAQQSTLQKQQNIVNPLDNFAKYDRMVHDKYVSYTAAQPAALTKEQREAVHKQADILEQLQILMKNRATPPSEAYKKEMRALYSPDEWKVISGEMPANLWEKKQLERVYKDPTALRGAGLSLTDTEEDEEDVGKNSLFAPFAPLAEKEADFAEKQLQPFGESQYDDQNRQQLIENQARNLSHLRQLMRESKYDTNLQQELWQTYQDYPEQWEVIMGRKSPEEWARWQTQDDKFEAFKEHRREMLRRQNWDQRLENLPENAKIEIKHVDREGNVLPEERRYPWEQQGTYRAEGQPKMVPGFSEDDIPIVPENTVLPATEVGGEKCEAILLNLSEEEQQVIHEMCMVAGVDYSLVLVTIAHESNSNPLSVNKITKAAGLMQITPKNWTNYTGSGYYTKNETVQKIYDVIGGLDAVTDKFNKYHNIAAGIAQYYMWQSKGYDFRESMSQVVNHYGEGKTYNKEVTDSRYVYPILAPATLEVLYQRDMLAMQMGQVPWYVGVYYTAAGEQLRNIEQGYEDENA